MLAALITMFCIAFFVCNVLFLSYLDRIMVLNKSRKIIVAISLINTLLGAGMEFATDEPFITTYLIVTLIYLIEIIIFFDETILVKIAFGLMIPIHLIAVTLIVATLLALSLQGDLSVIVHDPYLLFSVMILTSIFLSLFIQVMSQMMSLRYCLILKGDNKMLKLFVFIEIVIISDLLINSLIYDIPNMFNLFMGVSLILSCITKLILFYAGIFMVIGVDVVAEHKVKTSSKLVNSMYQKMCLDNSECVMEVDCITGRLLNHTISGEVQPKLIGTYYEKFIKDMMIADIHADDIKIVGDKSELSYMRSDLDNGQKQYEYEYRKLDLNGEYYYCRATVNVAKGDDNISAIVKVRNVQAEKDLLVKSEIDQLSGLYNKKTTEMMITRSLQTTDNGVLFMIDIDNFKSINDKFGHDKGDEVIVDVASKIKKVFRDNDIVGRVGGDEFMVFITGNANVIQKAEQLCSSIKCTYHVEDVEVTISASIGIAYSEAGITFNRLYKLADTALYGSKRKGKDTYTMCDSYSCT
ncbi:MAG: hypothetical protein BEN18_08690 [Epulopiscium sp. Nuni2H_MBin001]|nr:MAG: hypothetical protein BEN18_08690 [Epulopiscium sp. Nuni2H_MBin001]